MPKNLVIYTTSRVRTTKLMRIFADGINTQSPNEWDIKILPIDSFLENSAHIKDTDAIACFGILRGTGLALQEAARLGIDRYFIDHAYFNRGYGGEGWLRLSKNKHTLNYMKTPNTGRWEEIFSKEYEHQIKPWKHKGSRGDKILILPPTHAMKWYFRCHNWEKELVEKLKKLLPEHHYSKIKIRPKPNEPIVDKLGNLLRFDKSVPEDALSLEQDLQEANIVIAYNSNVTLEATRLGIPVITSNHNCSYPISFDLNDLLVNFHNPKFDIEPDRLSLFRWLANNQFTKEEFRKGYAWKIVNQFQGNVQ
jgi:hypothetical protein